jgi:hypothetical protein
MTFFAIDRVGPLRYHFLPATDVQALVDPRAT